MGKYKMAKGCKECGYNANPVALDFNHRDPSTKEFMPSSRMLTMSLKRIIAEVRKCDVLCANCHRIHTYDNKHFHKSGHNDYST